MYSANESAGKSPRPRAIAYVDANNLDSYLRNDRGLRYVDVGRLLDSIVPYADLTKVYYFTTRFLDVPSSPGEISRRNRHHLYLQALSASDPRIELVYGQYRYRRVRGSLKPHSEEHGEVHRYVEKGTDVNLAVKMVDDAWRGNMDVSILVSNDSDLVAPLLVQRERGIRSVLVPPVQTCDDGRPGKVCMRLREAATDVREFRGSALRKHILPAEILCPNGDRIRSVNGNTVWKLPRHVSVAPAEVMS